MSKEVVLNTFTAVESTMHQTHVTEESVDPHLNNKSHHHKPAHAQQYDALATTVLTEKLVALNLVNCPQKSNYIYMGWALAHNI